MTNKSEMPVEIKAWYSSNVADSLLRAGQFLDIRCPFNEPYMIHYLRADKVRELVKLHEEFRDLLLKYRFTPGVPDELNAKAEEIDNLQSALFPEGVEKK